jgi:hypothetical protein
MLKKPLDCFSDFFLSPTLSVWSDTLKKYRGGGTAVIFLNCGIDNGTDKRTTVLPRYRYNLRYIKKNAWIILSARLPVPYHYNLLFTLDNNIFSKLVSNNLF